MTVLSFPYTRLKLVEPHILYPSGYKTVPMVPITLVAGSRAVPVTLVVDSGADYTILSLEVAKLLGLRLASGVKTVFCGTSGKRQEAHIHPVEITLQDAHDVVHYTAEVAFGDLPQSVAGLLGRVGFFDHFVVTFNQEKEQLLLRHTG